MGDGETGTVDTEGAAAVERYLAALDAVRNGDLDAIDAATEAAFVAHARAYAAGHGISYRAWRAVGVSVEVLRRAGITR